MNVVYEDNHLIVLNKPAGLLTQPSGTAQDSLESLLKAWLKKKYDKPGNVFAEAIHRLDKDASGLVLFAKTSKALKRLNAMMRQKEYKKIYTLSVEGSLENKEGTLEHFLLHASHRSRVAKAHEKEAKLARLHYRVINGSTLEVELETGRYHQIRCQMAAIGHPILGDTKYGAKAWNKVGIALHHASLSFPHPISKELLTLTS